MDQSDDSQYSDEEYEKAPGTVTPYFATADPVKITTVSPELQKTFNKMTNSYYDLQAEGSPDLEYGPDDIWPIQYAIANTFMTTEGVTGLTSGTNTGKTLTMIAAAELSDVCLVTVPGNAFGQWIKFLQRYKLYNASVPEKSPWLVYSHQHARPHLIYMTRPVESKPRAEKLRGRDRLVVLCIHSNIDEVMSKIFTPAAIGDREFTVIVDEAHLSISKLGAWVQVEVGKLVTRELLASGSELTAKILKKNGVSELDHTIRVHAVNTGPEDIWHIKLMPTESYKNGDERVWIKEVKAIASKARRIVIFAEVDMRDMLIAHSSFGDKDVYVQASQQNTIPKFKANPNAVLFLTRRKATGLNIDADTMIFLNPGESTTEVLIQATKRIIRVENTEPVVDIYMLCGTPKEYYRVIYAKAFSLQEWPFGRQEVVNTSMVYKSIAAIRLLGFSQDEVDRVDLCVFLADYAELELTGKLTRPYEQVLEWWEDNKLETSILTPDIIRNLIIV